jgi:hypothetical protein
MKMYTYFNQPKERLFCSLLTVCITWAVASPLALADNEVAAKGATDRETVTIIVDECQKEITVPASERDVRIVLSNTLQQRGSDSVSEPPRQDRSQGQWRAVGADSCQVPFATQLERLDCRTWQLRQHYSDATARYRERVNNARYSDRWIE